MSDGRKTLGRAGEDEAVARLVAAGWEIVARNWRTRAGEIDIIAREGDWLVFVEVKTRRVGAGGAPYLGRPEEAVTAKKQLQLARMAELYLHELRWGGLWRADVIAIELDARDAVARFAHYRDAVGG